MSATRSWKRSLKARDLLGKDEFAGLDTIHCATRVDAGERKRLLEHDFRVKARMVKVFPGQELGFDRLGLRKADPG
jgi:hypothetical protein